MKLLILNRLDVTHLLPMEVCLELVAEGLEALGRGEAVNPLRPMMWLPDKRGLLGLMPGYVAGREALGLKVISIFPGNHGTEYDSHQGGVLLFDTEHGCLRALIDAGAVTAIRTAAASGVATRLLAREDAGDLALLGSGVQARTHLEAMRVVREIRRVRVWSRTTAHVQAFAKEESERQGVAIEVVESVQEAVEGADLICTLTAAPEPILMGDWISPGAHINAVGASISATRELDTAAVVKSRLFVDRRESTANESGDFLIPRQEGAIGEDHILGEIGEILLEQIGGRTSGEEVTLFKSLGLAVEDVVPAHYLYHRAKEEGVGTWVDFGDDVDEG